MPLNTGSYAARLQIKSCHKAAISEINPQSAIAGCGIDSDIAQFVKDNALMGSELEISTTRAGKNTNVLQITGKREKRIDGD